VPLMSGTSTWAAMRRVLACAAFATLLACAGTAVAPPAPPAQPEAASGWVDKPGWATRRFAVAAANPIAVQTGYRIIREGGTAVDAAVAMQMVLALVEPQSSGLGGGAFLIHYDGRRTEAFDGRETAPAAADEKLFLGPDGKPLPFRQAIIGGRAVGVPGAIAMLEQAHRLHGRLPWSRLFEPAIALAESGFPVSPRFHALLTSDNDLKSDPVADAYFHDASGQPWPVGHVLRNPELAAVLRLVAAQGAKALSQGELAQAIVDKVRKHQTNPGRLALSDLAAYRPVQREPLCFDYAAAAREYRVCGMPPPSSGAIAIGQILGMLAYTPASRLPLDNGVPSAQWLHFYAEASRLAFADRALYVADPDFVAAPAGAWTSLLDPSYLQQRASLIGPSRMPHASAGHPGGASVSFAPMALQEEHGTSHISIVDPQGNALAMTSSIEYAFGSHQMVNRGRGLSGGFLLNNQLSDFSFQPKDETGRPVANRVQPGKRPRSAMAPTLVFDKRSGQLLMSVGSSGGTMIIHSTAKTLYGVFNWGLDIQRAIALPNFGNFGEGALLMEEMRFPEATLQFLRDRGHVISKVRVPTGLQGITRTTTGFFSGTDPRREGMVAGD
jgi:gamma-glutamyltranspeptidase / glutathione hydrolase